MRKILKKNSNPPKCPGCNDSTYVTLHDPATNSSIKDPWCGRCHHWFKISR